MAEMTPEIKQMLENAHYEIVGKHSAVSICSWTKHSLLNEGVCYKQKFYGINCHKCCQMTPATCWCNHQCSFCWRPMEKASLGIEMKGEVDSPKEIVDGCIIAQRRKLSGFKGNEKTDMKKWEEAQNPMHFAISLAGEPTVYPKLPELIKEIHSRGHTSFLVTNGTHPEMIQRLKDEDALPTQFYVSLDAPNKEIYLKVDRPLVKDGWEKLNEILELMPKLDTRKVVRITVVKGINDCCIKEYAELIRKSQTHYIEVKSYMFVGASRDRLVLENMPSHEEIREFSEKLSKELGWPILDEQPRSRVVLIGREDYSNRLMKF